MPPPEPAPDLAEALANARQPLKAMPADDVAKIVRRVTDPQPGDYTVAAFNSSI